METNNKQFRVEINEKIGKRYHFLVKINNHICEMVTIKPSRRNQKYGYAQLCSQIFTK